MTWLLRFSDPAVAWALEAARICLVIVGSGVAGWTVGFGMGYRRGATDAIAGDIIRADHRVNEE
ncbi:MAG TPA: hypothetical protein VE687_19520 [Stellaceae bacterium]|nr:hypothetical protein [Stellaceae bacterium]